MKRAIPPVMSVSVMVVFSLLFAEAFCRFRKGVSSQMKFLQEKLQENETRSDYLLERHP